MASTPDPLPALTPAERALIKQFNEDDRWTRETLLANLIAHLELAVEIELATIPIYLYTYYSLDRTHISGTDAKRARTEYSHVELFANEAGGRILSVVVEEMLHLSLSSNILYAVGGEPMIYGRSPASYPTNLPGHTGKGPDGEPLAIPLAKFSYEQLWRFLEIEYPAAVDAQPEANDWRTIGQVYAYVRCIICSDKLSDADFRARLLEHQIHPSNYSPNSIDTAYPRKNFDKHDAPHDKGSAAKAAVFANAADSHAGVAELVRIESKHDALVAIATICDQGEGFAHTRSDDTSDHELSHYFKFLVLQSQLKGYPDAERPAKLPKPPPAPGRQFGPDDLAPVVFDFPNSPTTADYPDEEQQDISNFCTGLYQYMLILTETIFRVPSVEQKLFFNRAMHLSMIWMLDKLIQTMRTISIKGGKFDGQALAPTFENGSLLFSRAKAYANLVELGEKIKANPDVGWVYTTYIATDNAGTKLPDVSEYWS